MKSNKSLAAVVAILALVFGVPAVANIDSSTVGGVNADLSFRDGLLVDVEVVDTTVPPTTTTTEPPVTTTTEPPVTTTTEPPVTTTTTTPPVTTTTTIPPGEEPPLGDDPAPPTGPAFIILNGGNAGGGNQNLWDAPYFRELNSGCAWVEGDRDGYRASYMFLACGDHPSIPTYFDAVDAAQEALQQFGRGSAEYQAAAGVVAQTARAIPVDLLIGKVTFIGGYGTITTAVQDAFMNEAERYYDGTPYDGPPIRELNDAPRPASLGDQSGPDRRPVLRYYERATGDVVEVRSYLNPDSLGPNVVFDVAQHIEDSFFDDSAPISGNDVYERIVVGSYLEGFEAVNVYYDVIHEGYGLDLQFPLEVLPLEEAA